MALVETVKFELAEDFTDAWKAWFITHGLDWEATPIDGWVEVNGRGIRYEAYAGPDDDTRVTRTVQLAAPPAPFPGGV